MSTLLESLSAAGAVRPLDAHFADLLARRGGETDPRVLAAAALAGSVTMSGHVCVDLARVGEILTEEASRVGGEDGPVLPELPDPADWRRALAASSSVRAPGEERATPLVLAGDALYLDRFWTCRQRVVAALERLVTAGTPPGVDPVVVGTIAAAMFDEDPRTLRQRQAVVTAVLKHLTVIAGGPGTGKTAVVVRVLAALNALARAAGDPLPRVALVAPTGKAAARLTESIRQTREVWLPEAMREGIADEATTIHRRLGMSPRTGRPRHDANRPLRADVVVVDEASMVDLPLMACLMDALRPGARLILLGDPDQLVSVEMGAVLGDVRRSASGPKSSALQADLAAAGAALEPAGVGSATGPLLADSLVTLEHTWRYGPDSGIAALARAVNAGEASAALAVFEAADGDVERVETPEGGGWRALFALLRPRIVRAYRAVVTETDPALALVALRSFRVLCAHRRGVRGVQTLNRVIEEWLAKEGLIDPQGQHYRGRPILVGRNDPRHGLFNGDVGILLPDPPRGGGLRAWFEGPDGTVRGVGLAVLPEHATVFATTVHKSQGSEYSEVLVVLPDRPSPLLTRELLYTAVTRATTKVTVVGAAERITEAVERPVERMSGWAWGGRRG